MCIRDSDYAIKRYGDIQASIFNNAGDNYFTILRHISTNVSETTETLSEKYKPQAKRKSQWDSRLMFGLLVIILFGGIISISLNVLLFRVAITRLFKSQRLMQRVTRLLKTDNISATHETFIGKRTCITMAATVVTFAIVLAIIETLDPVICW